MEMTGGSTSQVLDGVSGDYSPDRSLTPLVITPKLIVKDSDGVLVSGDHTKQLTDIRWYLASDGEDETTRILSTNTKYVVGSYGVLTVKENVVPDSPVNLFFSCAYLDSRSGNTYRATYQLTLSSTKAIAVNLAVSIDATSKMPISPFKSVQQRTITATLYNGENLVDDDNAIYNWQVQDGSSWRDITEDDLLYVSGQGTKAITIDQSYIDKEVIRVQASHVASPTKTVTAQTKLYRWYGLWDERVKIVRGKYIRPDTKEIETKCIIDLPKGQISNPAKYFSIAHIFTTSATNATQTMLGYGESFTVDASIAGTDPKVIPVFGVEVKERTALRACSVNGSVLTVNGSILTYQDIKD
jgi:hypothetical protein